MLVSVGLRVQNWSRAVVSKKIVWAVAVALVKPTLLVLDVNISVNAVNHINTLKFDFGYRMKLPCRVLLDDVTQKISVVV